jgi:hypothetical protein
VVGKLTLSYSGINAVEKIKKIINLINTDFSCDNIYVEIPPNYELIWKEQSHMELFEEFTEDRIKEIITESGEKVSLFSIKFTISKKE